MRHLNNDGMYFVDLKGDTAFGVSPDQLHFYHLKDCHIKAGDEIPEDAMERVKSDEPHTVICFEKMESIDVMISALLNLKEKRIERDALNSKESEEK